MKKEYRSKYLEHWVEVNSYSSEWICHCPKKGSILLSKKPLFCPRCGHILEKLYPKYEGQMANFKGHTFVVTGEQDATNDQKYLRLECKCCHPEYRVKIECHEGFFEDIIKKNL